MSPVLIELARERYQVGTEAKVVVVPKSVINIVMHDTDEVLKLDFTYNVKYTLVTAFRNGVVFLHGVSKFK